MNYESEGAARRKEGFTRFISGARRALAVPFNYFLRLGPSERILILVFLIVLFAPRLKDPIIQIINAIRGLPTGGH